MTSHNAKGSEHCSINIASQWRSVRKSLSFCLDAKSSVEDSE